jgi:hypothetical protein
VDFGITLGASGGQYGTIKGQTTLSKPPRYRQAVSLNPTTAGNGCMTSN